MDEKDETATQVWVCSRSSSLTFQWGVKRDLDGEAVPLILEIGGSGSLPTEIQISPGGQVVTETKGSYMMDTDAQVAIIAAFQASGKDLVIDYEHQTVAGGEAPAAGWITRLIAKGADGLWAVVNWTERAAQYLTAREYRYLSPVLLVRKADRRAVRIHSVALTNTPEIRNLVPLVASRHMHVDLNTEEEMREHLITMLKLQADATDEAILAALAERITPGVPTELVEALALSATSSVSDAVATIHALRQGQAAAGTLQSVQAELTTLKTQIAQRNATELVTAALSAGKITPAQREWAEAYAARDPEGFQTFVAKSPVIAPVGGAVTRALSQTGGPGLDEAQRQINRALGVTDELYLKHAPKAA